MPELIPSGRGAERRDRLSSARLYLILETSADGRGVEPLVGEALRGGVDVVQIRDKEATDAEVVACGRRLATRCRRAGALLVVNDRPDLALACAADGVHVGQGDDHPDEVRRTAGPDLLIGVSTHSPEQIAAAGETSADYLGVGPVYATATKPDVAPVGLELVRHAAAHSTKPFFAIGGIDAERAPEVAGAGAQRVAVVRAIRDARDPRAAARSLRRALDREPVGGPAG